MKILSLLIIPMFLLLFICQWANGEESGLFQLKDYLSNTRYPQDYWQISTPEILGLKAGKLMKAVEFIENYEYEIHSFLIVKKGVLYLSDTGII